MESVIGDFRGYDRNLKWQQTLMYHTLKVITPFNWSTLWNISRTIESIPKWRFVRSNFRGNYTYFFSMSDIIMVLDFYYTYSFLNQVLDLIFSGGKKRDLSPYVNINRF